MPNSGLAEIYFIAAMMVLIVVVCVVSVFLFFRTYNREKLAKEQAKIEKAKKAELQNQETAQNPQARN